MSGRNLPSVPVFQMRPDPGEAGEHPCGPAEPLPRRRHGHEGGAHRRDESLRQPRPGERGARPDIILHGF